MHEFIKIKGARENNLKNIDINIPRDKLVVITGISGSGKSSLAFDTIYAEGQRRYVESLSSYARQFLGQMEKPDVDHIDGLSPAISIDQKTTSKNPRSTVGTVTEIYDYLRLLYARAGTPHCPQCFKEISKQTIDQMVDKILSLEKGTRIYVLSPVIQGKKGEHVKVFNDARKSGFIRAKVDGDVYDLSEEIILDKNKKHTIQIVVDRLVIKEGIRTRLTDSIETAIREGIVLIDVIDSGELMFSSNYACEDCSISMEEFTPRMFSFNSPYGACNTCFGIGTLQKVDPSMIIPNENLTINEGAICASGWNRTEDGSIAKMYFEAIAKAYGFSLNKAIKDLPKKGLDAILYGTGDRELKLNVHRIKGGVLSQTFEGVINNLERRHKETTSDFMRLEIENCMCETVCKDCGGYRLRQDVLAVTLGGINIAQFAGLSIGRCIEFIENLSLTNVQMQIADTILKEIKERLGFLKSVGLEYLTLSRGAGTLSGGESQRIRLATQIGSSLMGVLYILDEPSIGLHQRDNDKLLETLKHLRDLGNTLIVVEHDEDTMFTADHIIDIGPGAGVHGGHVVFEGSLDEILKSENSITGKYLSGRLSIPVPKKRRKGNGNKLVLTGATMNNLQNVNLTLHLGTLTAITGVSGSGKSTLINQILYKKLAMDLNRAKDKPGEFTSIKGVEFLDKVIDIDQSPIGRTPRSNPATYTGVFSDIRELFTSTNDAKSRGYTSGRFSFNVKGGRCEACSGDGVKKIEMHFLPDIFVSCEACDGKRYNRETLEVRYKGKNIYEVLQMTIEEAGEFFENIPKIARKMQVLGEVGLGYIKLGQASTTLSGGEAQRVKLATELSKRPTGKTIYILDEPTTGLHIADVHRLVDVLQQLVDTGNTVVVIEHNLDVIKTADRIVDLGPEGGEKGGNILFDGVPEKIIECKESYTGKYLKKYLG